MIPLWWFCLLEGGFGGMRRDVADSNLHGLELGLKWRTKCHCVWVIDMFTGKPDLQDFSLWCLYCSIRCQYYKIEKSMMNFLSSLYVFFYYVVNPQNTHTHKDINNISSCDVCLKQKYTWQWWVISRIMSSFYYVFLYFVGFLWWTYVIIL